MSLLISRPLTELPVLPDRGALYYENGMGLIENNYTLKLVNKLESPVSYKLSVEGDMLLLLVSKAYRLFSCFLNLWRVSKHVFVLCSTSFSKTRECPAPPPFQVVR